MSTTPVVVTTKHRGIFVGLMKSDTPFNADTVQLERCRMAVNFKKTGAIGLASGPTGRVSGMSMSANIKDVTAWFECTADGWAAWDAVDEKNGQS